MIILQANNSTPPVTISIPVDLAKSCSNAIETTNDLLRKGFERNGGDARLFNKLVRQATVLTNALLTAEQLQQLAELPEGTTLTVTAPLSQFTVPWELLRINEQFLCERFAVGRIATDNPCVAKNRTSHSATGSATVLIAQAWELVSTNTERTIVERRLRQLSHDFPEKLTTLRSSHTQLHADAFCQALEDSCWLHFAGHAVEIDGVRCLGNSNNAKLEIPDSTQHSPASIEADSGSAMGLFRPSDLKDLSSASEVVFLNACGALQLPSKEANGLAQQQESLVSELLRLGTRWLIGPVVPVLDSQTRHFTTEFYDAIGQDCSFGEAMRQARLHACEKLGPHNLLPLSYVLYGDPSVLLFPERTFMSPAVNSAPPVAKAASDLRFPCTCSRCGIVIETRHGLDSHASASTSDSVICRSCARQTRPDVPREASLVRPFLPAVPATVIALRKVANAESGATLSDLTQATAGGREMSDAEKAFRQYLAECLNRPVSWMDLRTGIKVVASLEQFESATQNAARSGLAELDRSLKTHAVPAVQRYTIRGTKGDNIGSFTIVIVPESNVHDKLPMTNDSLTALMTSLNAESNGTHDYLFVCSMTGFAEDCRQQLAAELAPSWYGNQRSILLHDVSSQKTHFRKVDLLAHGLANVLQRESTSRQFQQAVAWLEQQLPLVTSVSSEHVTKQLKLEADAVESAIRCVASQNDLVLEQTTDFGLVLSEQTVSEFGSSVLTSGRSTCVTGKAIKVIFWPLTALGRFLGWTFV